MGDHANGLTEHDEDVLTFNVEDDVLERGGAASSGQP
jgi:hypothetical protein